MDKEELKKFLQEMKEGKANVFDRKNTSITFRCSIPIKTWVHQQALDKGFESVSAYIEHCLIKAEKTEEKETENAQIEELKEFNELIKAYKGFKEEYEQLKAKHEKIKALCEKARGFTNEEPNDFYHFRLYLEELI